METEGRTHRVSEPRRGILEESLANTLLPHRVQQVRTAAPGPTSSLGRAAKLSTSGPVRAAGSRRPLGREGCPSDACRSGNVSTRPESAGITSQKAIVPHVHGLLTGGVLRARTCCRAAVGTSRRNNSTSREALAPGTEHLQAGMRGGAGGRGPSCVCSAPPKPLAVPHEGVVWRVFSEGVHSLTETVGPGRQGDESHWGRSLR